MAKIKGTDCDDILIGTPGDDEILGGDGDDLLLGLAGDDTLDGGDGNDTLIGGDGDDALIGGDGCDLLIGGIGDDALYGGDHSDVLIGGTGDDKLDGGKGADHLFGGAGDDLLKGGKGDDLLVGGIGGDKLHGGKGHDLLFGGAGDDLLKGGKGHDLLTGGLGRDKLHGGKGHDLLFGGAGDDLLKGGKGRDLLVGGPGNDKLLGGKGSDNIVGGSGDDVITGGRGNDRLDGGAGSDELKGGSGDDSFIIGDITGGPDTVIDYTDGDDTVELNVLDRLGIDPSNIRVFLEIERVGSDTVVRVDVDGAAGESNFIEAAILAGYEGDTVEVVIDGTAYTVPVDAGGGNNPPTVSDQSFGIDENTASGAAVGTIVATDPDVGDELTFTVTRGTGSTAFEVDSISGAITVTDPSQLDFETTPSFTLDVLVTDLGGLTDTATITIDLSDVNEAPVLAAIGDQAVDEKSLLTFTAAATDPDVPANGLTFSLDAGAPPGATIDPVSGVFSWTPTEAQGPGTFGVTVQVTDDGTRPSPIPRRSLSR